MKNKFTSAIDFSKYDKPKILAESTNVEGFGTAVYFNEEPFDLLATKIEQAKALTFACTCDIPSLNLETSQALYFLLLELMDQIDALYMGSIKNGGAV